ncbi:MAG: helix-turn-helix domain-containing protein [Acidobacteria bacterium]|nr:helix-turn-helix domain-containing protein [Acidobacteriota bacterium]
MNKFAILLSDAVKRQKITYKKAAEWSDVSPDLISRIVLGNRLPSPKNAIKIAKALGIDQEEALMALNYDKVPKNAKKYFSPPKPKYPILRKFLQDKYSGDRRIGKRIFSEIIQFSFGSMEMLIVSRILSGTIEYYESTAKQMSEAKKNIDFLHKILASPSLDLEDDNYLLEILSPLMKWESLLPAFTLNLVFSSAAGSLVEVSTGETRFEKTIVTTTNSEPIEVPLMEDKIAAGSPLPISGNWNETRFFTASFLRKFSDPILIEVGKDQDSMIPVIFPGDLLLIDRKPFEKTRRNGIYAVNLDEGGSVKYCNLDKGILKITCENRFASFESIEISVAEKSLSEIIVGEVVWIGREMNRR